MLTHIDLHASLTDPTLGVMTFLNEITGRYPDAVSFAPGRPYEGFFSMDLIDRYLDAYVDHLRTSRGLPQAEIVRELFQYGPSAGTIRTVVADMLARDEGIRVSPEAVVMTDG